MRKIPTLFARSDDRRHVIDEVTPGCEWVLIGQGIATRKYDGTCMMLDGDGTWFARRELKAQTLSAPDGFILADRDEVTGKIVGWVDAEQSSFAKYFDEAIANGIERANEIRELTGDDVQAFHQGTYELCGPKINGNPESYASHLLVEHAMAQQVHVPLTFSGLADWMSRTPYEGVVWHHPDGRMAKLKRRDFPKATP